MLQFEFFVNLVRISDCIYTQTQRKQVLETLNEPSSIISACILLALKMKLLQSRHQSGHPWWTNPSPKRWHRCISGGRWPRNGSPEIKVGFVVVKDHQWGSEQNCKCLLTQLLTVLNILITNKQLCKTFMAKKIKVNAKLGN